MDFLLTLYLGWQQRKYHLKVVEMRSYQERKLANSFLQEESAKYFGHDKIEQTKELVNPDGLVGSFCILKNESIVGTVSLFDPSEITSFAAHAYIDHELKFDEKKTLELGRLIVSASEQRADSFAYLLLMFACYKRAKAMKRTQWLSTAHYRVIRQAKHLGAEIEILARGTRIAQDDSFQSYYYSNLIIEEDPEDYSAFIVQCDKKALRRAAKKYFKRKRKKLFKAK